MIEALAVILFVLSVPLLLVLAVIGIDAVVSPQEMSEYKMKVRQLRQAGMRDEQICKELKITKEFLRKLEEVTYI